MIAWELPLHMKSLVYSRSGHRLSSSFSYLENRKTTASRQQRRCSISSRSSARQRNHPNRVQRTIGACNRVVGLLVLKVHETRRQTDFREYQFSESWSENEHAYCDGVDTRVWSILYSWLDRMVYSLIGHTAWSWSNMSNHDMSQCLYAPCSVLLHRYTAVVPPCGILFIGPVGDLLPADIQDCR